MNAPLFIFSPDANGQPAAALKGSTSAAGDNAFADSLTAALAASTLASALPVQQQAAKPMITVDGSLIGGGPHRSETAAIEQPLSSLAGQGTDPAKTAGAHGVGSGTDLIGPATAGPDGNAPAAGAENVAAAPVEIASLDIETPHAREAMARAAGDPVSIEPEGAIIARSQLHADRPDDGRAPDQLDLHVEKNPSVGALASVEQGRPSAINADQPQVHPPIDKAPVMAARPLDILTSVDDLAPLTPPSRPSAGMALDQLEQPVGRSEPAAPFNQVKQALSAAAPVPPQAPAVGTQTTSTLPDPSRRPIEMPAGPAVVDAPIDVQRDVSILAASRQETTPLPAGRPANNRPTAPAAGEATVPASASPPRALVEPSRSGDMRSVETRPYRSPGVARDHAGQPTASAVNTAHLAQPGPPDPSVHQGGVGGIDRLQPALSLEAAVQDVERFEPATSVAPPKAPGSAAQPSASAQIALQIVRSLPKGIDRLSLHLHPAELGSVDIRLDFEGSGRMTAMITAERPETLELLQRDSRFLERSLGDNGLKLANDGLSFSLKQDQPGQQQSQSFQDQAQSRQAAVQAGRAYDDMPDLEQPPSTMRVDGLRLLDIKT